MAIRKLKNAGISDRPKAWVGAAIGAATSILGSVLSSNAAARQAEEQKRMIEHQNALQSAANMTEALNLTRNAQKEYENRFRASYKCGGRRKLRNGFRITDGGTAIPIDYNTYLLRGSSHDEVNESGKTGIGIKVYSKGGRVKGKEVEVEDGEVVQKTPNEIRVFSDNIGLGNYTFADLVKMGYNKDELFDIQQRMNGDYGKRYLRTGGRPRADLGANFTTADWIGLGTNVAGSLLSGIVGNSILSGIEAPRRPVFTLPGKLITNWNIASRLSEVNNLKHRLLNDSDDLVSSASRLDRRNDIALATLEQANKLWEEKTNKEVELGNQDTLNQQQVIQQGIQNYNNYLKDLAAFNQGLMKDKLESNVGMIQGIGSSIGGFLQQGIDNYQADQAMRAMIAASPYGTAARMKRLGFKFSDDFEKDLASDAQYTIDRYKNDNSTQGLKNYNDAVDAYNLFRRNVPYKYRRVSLGNVNPINFSYTDLFKRKPVINIPK